MLDVIVYETYASFDSMGELPKDELPTILYDGSSK